MSGAATADSAPVASKRRFLAALVLLAVIAAAVRVVAARDSWGFGQDSFSYLSAAKYFRDGSWRTEWSVRFLHPVYPLLVALGGVFTRDLEIVARAVSILAMTASVVVAGVYWARWRGEAEGLLVAAMTCVQPALVSYGSEIWTEPITVPLLAAAIAVCARMRRDGLRPRTAALAGALFGLLVLVKTPNLLWAPPAALAAAWPALRRRRLRELTVGAAAFVGALAPLVAAPHVAHWAMHGRYFDVLAYERTSTDSQFRSGSLGFGPGAARDQADASPPDEHVFAGKALANARLLATHYAPRHAFPWFLVVPLAVAGWLRLRRDRGPAYDFCVVSGAAISFEWAARCAFTLCDRYLVPGVVLSVPLAAVGAATLIRWGSSRPRLTRLLAWAPLVLVVASWNWFFFRQFVQPGRRARPYEDAGRRLAAFGDARPRRLVALDPQTCWFGGAERTRLSPVAPDDVAGLLSSTGADGIVVGPAELQVAPLLASALDVPPGGTWHGLRVLSRADGISVLVR